jgi:hypothetical protein
LVIFFFAIGMNYKVSSHRLAPKESVPYDVSL